MALDNYPMPCGCFKHPHAKKPQFSHTTHAYSEACPFRGDGFPRGRNGNCCSLNGKIAAHELEALDEDATARGMRKDMSCAEANAFARELRDAADRLESRHAGEAEKPSGAVWFGYWDGRREEVEYQEASTFEEAIASIRQAADWYEKVAEMGFGVMAVEK